MNTKNTVIGAIALVVLGAGGWYVYTSQKENAALPGGAVAIVNGEEIPRADYDGIEAQMAAAAGADLAALTGETKAQLQAQAIDALVSRTLLRQAVQRSGISTSSEEVDARLATIKGQFPDEAAYAAALSAQGMTEEKLRAEVSAALATDAYLNQTLNFSSLTVSDAEIQAAYDTAAAASEVPPLNEVREQVSAQVLQAKQSQLVAAHVEELRSAADIKVLI